MAADFYNPPTFWRDTLEAFNWIFMIIYWIEISLKLLGLTLQFFRDPWNVFDMVLHLTLLRLGVTFVCTCHEAFDRVRCDRNTPCLLQLVVFGSTVEQAFNTTGGSSPINVLRVLRLVKVIDFSTSLVEPKAWDVV